VERVKVGCEEREVRVARISYLQHLILVMQATGSAPPNDSATGRESAGGARRGPVRAGVFVSRGRAESVLFLLFPSLPVPSPSLLRPHESEDKNADELLDRSNWNNIARAPAARIFG